MKRQRHIALLILFLLLPGIAGNVTLHACWVPAVEDCCELETGACCEDSEATPCDDPSCTACEPAVPVQDDDCECSTCHVTLPGKDIVATVPAAKKIDMDGVPLADVFVPCCETAAVAALAPQTEDFSPSLFPGIPTTVLLI